MPSRPHAEVERTLRKIYEAKRPEHQRFFKEFIDHMSSLESTETTKKIAGDLDIGYSTALAHVKSLRKQGIIPEDLVARSFDLINPMKKEQARIKVSRVYDSLDVQARETLRSILDYLSEQKEPVTKAEIVENTDYTLTPIIYHLERLADAGLDQRDLVGRTFDFVINPKRRKVLMEHYLSLDILGRQALGRIVKHVSASDKSIRPKRLAQLIGRTPTITSVHLRWLREKGIRQEDLVGGKFRLVPELKQEDIENKVREVHDSHKTNRKGFIQFIQHLSSLEEISANQQIARNISPGKNAVREFFSLLKAKGVHQEHLIGRELSIIPPKMDSDELQKTVDKYFEVTGVGGRQAARFAHYVKIRNAKDVARTELSSPNRRTLAKRALEIRKEIVDVLQEHPKLRTLVSKGFDITYWHRLRRN